MNNAYKANLQNRANTQQQITNSLAANRNNQGYFKEQNKGIYDDIDLDEILKNI